MIRLRRAVRTCGAVGVASLLMVACGGDAADTAPSDSTTSIASPVTSVSAPSTAVSVPEPSVATAPPASSVVADDATTEPPAGSVLADDATTEPPAAAAGSTVAAVAAIEVSETDVADLERQLDEIDQILTDLEADLSNDAES